MVVSGARRDRCGSGDSRRSPSPPAGASRATLFPAPWAVVFLSAGAVQQVIQFLPCNRGHGGGRGCGDEEWNASSVATAAPQRSPPSVSADALFAAAAQAPSTVMTAATGFSALLSSSSAPSQGLVCLTRPLALLAASPRWRCALEMYLSGGCALPPLGSLVLKALPRMPTDGPAGGGVRPSQKRTFSYRRGQRTTTAAGTPSCADGPSVSSGKSIATGEGTWGAVALPLQLHVSSANVAFTRRPFRSTCPSPTLTPQTPPLSSLSPVRQSQRLPIIAATATAVASPTAVPMSPPLSGFSTLPHDFSGAGLPVATREASSGDGAAKATSALRIAFSPRHAPAGSTPTPPLTPSEGSPSPPPSPALQTLCHAFWWIRRCRWLISLDLVRYTEDDVRVVGALFARGGHYPASAGHLPNRSRHGCPSENRKASVNAAVDADARSGGFRYTPCAEKIEHKVLKHPLPRRTDALGCGAAVFTVEVATPPQQGRSRPTEGSPPRSLSPSTMGPPLAAAATHARYCAAPHSPANPVSDVTPRRMPLPSSQTLRDGATVEHRCTFQDAPLPQVRLHGSVQMALPSSSPSPPLASIPTSTPTSPLNPPPLQRSPSWEPHTCVTQLQIHGGAAEAVVATLLPTYPEVRSLRLSHGALNDAQLRHLARYCPGITHLSLAMNKQIESTRFLGSPPSTASSGATETTTTTTPTTATTTTATAMVSTTVSAEAKIGSHDQASSPMRLCLPRCSTPQHRRSSDAALQPGLHVSPSPLLSYQLPSFSRLEAQPEDADGGPDTALASADRLSSDTVKDTTSGDMSTVRTRSEEGDDSADRTLCQHLCVGSHLRSTSTPRQSSQLDLFAPDEEGELEMRVSLWEAAQTDAAERRQPVVILRPHDVFLGRSSGAGSPVGTAKLGRAAAFSRSLRAGDVQRFGSILYERRHPASTVTALPGSPPRGEPPLSALEMISAENTPLAAAARRTSSFHTQSSTRATTSVTSHSHADPVMRVVPQSTTTSHIERAGVSPRRASSMHNAGSCREGKVVAACFSPLTMTPSTVAVSPPSPSPSPARHRQVKKDVGMAGAHTRRRRRYHRYCRGRCCERRGRGGAAVPYSSATYWGDSLIHLDLSYTHVTDEAAARDIPPLRCLQHLSLEGCLHVTEVRWLPLLRRLREVNLSLSSVQGRSLYPLGDSAQLEWLKLEGCSSFEVISQRWRRESVGEEEEGPERWEGQGVVGEATALTNATLDAGVVRHATGAGISAITVLPLVTRRRGGRGGAAELYGTTTPPVSRPHTPLPVVSAEPSGSGQMRSIQAASSASPLPTTRTADMVVKIPEELLTRSTAAVPLLKRLRILVASGTGLTDTGLRDIKEMSSLESLLLDRCVHLTDVNVAAELPSLRTLDISGTEVTAEGMAALQHSSTLQNLRAQRCEALRTLPAILAARPAALTMTMSTANTSSSASHRAAPTAATHPPLTVLDLSYTRHLTGDGLTRLTMNELAAEVQQAATAVAHTHPRRGSGGGGGGEPRALWRNDTVRRVLLRSCEAVDHLSALHGLTRVVELDLYHTRVTEVALAAALAAWTCLEVLNLSNTPVRSLAMWCPSDVAGEGEVGALPSYYTGSARGNSNTPALPPPLPRVLPFSQAYLPAFAATLRVLELSNTEVAAEGLTVIQFFNQLEVLKMSSCHRLCSLRFLKLASDAAPGTVAPFAGLSVGPPRVRCHGGRGPLE